MTHPPSKPGRPTALMRYTALLALFAAAGTLHAQQTTTTTGSNTTSGSNNVPPERTYWKLIPITAIKKGQKDLPYQLTTVIKVKNTVKGENPTDPPMDKGIGWSADKGTPIFTPKTGAIVELDFEKPFIKENTDEAKKVKVNATYTHPEPPSSKGSPSVDSSDDKMLKLTYLDFLIAKTEESTDDILIVRDEKYVLAGADKKVIHWAKVLVKHSATDKLPLELESSGEEKKLYFYGEEGDPNQLPADPPLKDKLSKEYKTDEWFWIGTDEKGPGEGKFKAKGDLGTGLKEAPEEKTVRLVPVEVVDKDKNSVTKLKVGKMCEDGVLGGATLDIDKDLDRFFVRIKEGAALGGISIKVSTKDNPDAKNYNDDATQIDLVADGADAITKSMLLVADDVDDVHRVDDVADDAPGDRTHKIQLEGSFNVEEIKIGTGAWQALNTKMPVIVEKTVHINIIRMADCGLTDVNADIVLAKERYAQVGIALIVDSNIVKPLPPGMDHSDVFATIIGILVGPIGIDSQNLINTYGTVSIEDIHIFYCRSVSYRSGDAAGYAYVENSLTGDKARYANNGLIAGNRKPFTLAHELCHILTNRGHFGVEYTNASYVIAHNLMKEGTSATNNIDSTKRIYEAQQGWIQSHRTAK